MCGVERKAITRWPDDKMVQSERGRTKVPGNGIEGGELDVRRRPI